MFGNMFSKFGKKNNDEYNEYEDEGNFSYNEDLKTNEFNDATIEYGDGEEIEEEIYEEDPHEIDKNKIMFYALIGGLILLVIIILLLRGCVFAEGKLKSIEITAPNIIYVGEKQEIKAKANGRGNFKNTIYKFDTSNNGIAEVENKDYVKGKSVTNNLIPITTGRFILQVSGQIGDVKLPAEKEIVICRRLSDQAFHSNSLTAVINKPIKLNVDLGEDNECFEGLTYKISDESIVKIDDDGNLVGLKKGSTTITFRSDGEEVTKEVNVSTDGKSVTGLSLNKSNVTLTVGSSETIKATITPKDATNKNINWTSSNSGVVTVSKTGKLTGVGKGTAVVKALTEDGGYTKLINVTVKNKTSGGNQGGSTSKDNTAPKLTSVKIYSNNTYSGYAKKDDKITLEMTFSEVLGTYPSVIMGGNATTSTCSGTVCKAVYTVVNTTPEGKINFTIDSYRDKAGNTGKVVTTTTNNSKVVVDKIQPSCSITSNRNDTTEKVKFTWFDSNTGVREYKKPNGTLVSASSVGTKKDGNETFTFNVEPVSYVVSMTITDWAGNTKNCSYTVQKKDSIQKTYTATFNTNTGVSNIGATSLSCTTTGTNKSCTVKAPSIIAQNGYTVVGWNTSKTATTAKYKVGSTITLDSNPTFYAIVSKNQQIVDQNKTYKVTFKKGTGVSSIGATSLSCTTTGTNTSCTVTAPSITPKSLYQTIGWCTSSSCTTANYNVGAKIELDSNETFYAVAKYKYSGGGGSSDDDDDDGGSSGKKCEIGTIGASFCDCCTKTIIQQYCGTYNQWYNRDTGKSCETECTCVIVD